MKRILYLFIVLITTVCFLPSQGMGQTEPLSSQRKIRVGLKVDPPYIIKQNDGFYGLSVDIWVKISNELGIAYEFVEYTHTQDIIVGLVSRKIDMTINPLTGSGQRIRQLDVSQPFLTSSMGVAISHVEDSQTQVFFSNLFSLSFLKLFGILVLIVFAFGFIVWFVEKKYNPTDFRDGIYGIMDGIWWSTVTITTVGYGDKTPKTTVGKIISMLWMFAAISLISSFTATIASTLTVNRLDVEVNTLQDLKKIGRIGTIRNSDTEDYLVRHQIKAYKRYNSVEDGLADLANGVIKAFAYDKAAIHYLVTEKCINDKVRLLSTTFNRHYLSWLTTRNHPIYRLINPSIADYPMREEWEKDLRKYNMENFK